MLFVSVGHIDAVWKAVVEATVSGELGQLKFQRIWESVIAKARQ